MALALLAALAALAGAARAEEAGAPWPDFLPPRESLPPAIAATVERVWTDRAFSRTVRGPSARAPFDLYAALVDLPDVTAAAARDRGIARHEVRWVEDGTYEATDGSGARGVYRVLVHERTRRVMVSWGEHTGSLLGTIRGEALTVLVLEPRAGEVGQVITAHVRLDSRLLAALARAFLLLFGGVADRKLAEAFALATRVADWAAARPDEFCDWLRRSGLPAERREPVRALLPACP